MRWTHCQSYAFKCRLWVALILWIGLLGCQKDDAPRQYTFLVLPRTLSNDFHASLVAGTKTAAAEQHIHLQIQAASTEDDFLFQEKQLFETIAQKAVDGVVLEPGHSTRLLPILRKLDEHGIPFVVVDNPIELANEPAFSHYCGFIGTDNRRGSGLAAEYIGTTLKTGNVLLIRGVMVHRTSQDRESGFLEKIKQHPNIKIARIVEGHWSSAGAAGALRQLSRADLSTIHAVFAYNDLMALGAAEVFRQYRLRPVIVGYDGILEAQSAILAGDLDATVSQAPERMGSRAVAKLRQCIEQQFYPAAIELTHVTLLIPTRTLTAISSYDQP